MKKTAIISYRIGLLALALSFSAVIANDELAPANSLKLSGCAFTLDQFVENCGSGGEKVSEAYRIYLLSGFSFEDVIFLKNEAQWDIYWRSGIRENVRTDFASIPNFKRRFNSDVAADLLRDLTTPRLWKELSHDSGDEGDDGFRVIVARWSNGETKFKHFRSKTTTSELAMAADSAHKFWKWFEKK